MNHCTIFIVIYIIANVLFVLGQTNDNKDTTSTNIIETNSTGIKTTTRRPLLQGLPQLKLPCSCAEGQCGCCTGVILERLRQKACVNITYEPDDFSITAKMSMNGRVLYKNTFSGKNPPPVCIRVPRLSFIELCVEFSNIYFAQRNIHMCVDAEASWQDFTLLEWSFDCIRLGSNGVAVIGEEDGGGVPATITDGEEQVDEDYDDNARNVPLKNIDKTSNSPVNATISHKGDIIFKVNSNYNFNYDD